MKIFKNLKTGVLEDVTNEKLIAQYEKYTDVYELIKDKKNTKKSNPENIDKNNEENN